MTNIESKLMDDWEAQFGVSPEDQGQIVEVAWCLCPAGIYQRVIDRSNRSRTYSYVAWGDIEADCDAWVAGDAGPPNEVLAALRPLGRST